MRQPKLRYRKDRDYYFVEINGERHNLGHDKEQAQYKYHKLLASPDSGESPIVAVLLDKYLDYVRENKAESTYQRRKPILSSFFRHIGIHLTVEQLKRHHVRDWIKRSYGHCASTTQSDCITVVVGALNWACEQDYIPTNPIAGIAKPERKKREFFLKPDEWHLVLNLIRDEDFRDYCLFGFQTGARPQEIRLAEPRHFECKNKRLLFPRDEAKGKKRPRAIYLDDMALEIIERRLGTGNIFKNTKGRPWTKDSVNCRFQRLKKKLKMPELCAYSLRHSFGYWKVSLGLEFAVIAKLMGHVDSRMIETRYGHLDKNVMLLQAASNSGVEMSHLTLP